MLAAASATAFVPKVPVRAILSDVDGTLFPFGTSQAVSAANVAALQSAIDLGLPVGLATGRIPGPWSDKVRQQVPALGAGVFGNGALVVSAEGRVLAADTLTADVVAAVTEYVRGGRTAAGAGGRVCLLACTRCDEEGEGAYPAEYLELAPEGQTWTTDLIQAAGEPIALVTALEGALAGRSVLKFVFFTRPDEAGWAAMDDTVAALREAVDGAAAVLDCGAAQCEVLPRGVNKGAGVAKLLARLGVPPSACLALGDAENDVEMLQLAGVGVAMGNAKPPARAAADVVVGTNDEDGVAEAVTRYVLEPAGRCTG